MSTWYLYVITNRRNGKKYVGITVDPVKRWKDHCRGIGSKLVHQAIKKYGVNALSFIVVGSASEEHIHDIEVMAIRKHNSRAGKGWGYNLTDGGTGSTGWKPSKETRQKMSGSHVGERNSMYGRTHSDEVRKRLSETMKARDWHHKQCSITVDGREYSSLKEAAAANGVKYRTFLTRIRRGHHPVLGPT